MLVEHFRIELTQFIEQDVVFLVDIVGIAGNHKEQQRITLYMPQETQSESLAFGRPFDDARDIGHHERLVVVITHDAQ